MNNKLFKHYNEIVNCEFMDDDNFSKKLVHYYKKYVGSCKLDNEECIKKARELDEAMYIYIEDYYFSLELQSIINVDAIVKDDDSYLEAFIDFFVNFFEQYNPNKRVKPVTRWI
ncbi:MAG: hypothetical protein GX032_00725 [Tenericutes bacterium]|nr:hypothetical protein [Mycoplasmatota bacterium]